MAADAGGIEPGEKVMACTGTMPETRYYSGHKATFTTDLLKNLRPGEMVAKLRLRVRPILEYQDQVWRENPDKCYF